MSSQAPASATAAQSLQRHRPRPTAKVLPVIPLSFMQKRKQDTAIVKNTSEKPSPSESIAATSTSPTNRIISLSIPSPSYKPLSVSVPDSTRAQAHGGPEQVKALEDNTTQSNNASATEDEAGAEQPLTEEEGSATVQGEESSPQLTPQTSVTPEGVLHENASESTPAMFSSLNPSTRERALVNNITGEPSQPLHSSTPEYQVHQSNSSVSFAENPTNIPSGPPSNGAMPFAPQVQLQFGGFARPVHHASEAYDNSVPFTNGNGYHVRNELDMSLRDTEAIPLRGVPQFVQSENSSSMGGIDGYHLAHEPPSANFHSRQSSNAHEMKASVSLPRHNPGYSGDIHESNGSRSIPRTASQGYVYSNYPANPYLASHSMISCPSQMAMRDELDGLVPYLLSQFGNSQTADYMLELRYSDDRAVPVRLNGHHLLFARSPTLKALINTDVQAARLPIRTLLIESDDRFLHSEAFQLAVQRLYGAPLLDSGVSTSSTSVLHMSDTQSERFDLAIGYAAAGHLLQMSPVLHRGIDIAAQFISWHTIEQAMDFCLDGGLDLLWTHNEPLRSPPSPPTYGPHVNVLLQAALNFMITSFPPNFELNTSVPESANLRRTPVLPDLRSVKSRLSGIRFGDHDAEEFDDSSPAVDTSLPGNILSRLLLVLPFHLLRHVLESSRLGNVAGWATTVLRQKVMHAVVQERESRRMNAYLCKAVGNKSRSENEKHWESIGWKESVIVVGPNNESILQREWVGFLLED